MKVLLTGGGGFLGGAIAERLVQRGHTVVSFSRGAHPHLAALGVEHRRGDLSDATSVIEAASGVEAIVHTAAKAGVWGDPNDYRRANVLGTRHVIAACRAHAVSRLVYTSTPSVAHAGGDIEGGDALALPYCTHPKTAYQATKTQAEREALAANDADLAVTALRPHLIWGPGDPHLVPRILSRVRRGRIALPGGGRKRVDTTYVDNAADVHVAALERLEASAPCAGRPYFVSNDEPIAVREIVLGILAAHDIEARVVPVPSGLARLAGGALERVYRRLERAEEPPLTRFVAEQLSTAHWFDIGDTKRDFEWSPAISIAEGLRRLADART